MDNIRFVLSLANNNDDDDVSFDLSPSLRGYLWYVMAWADSQLWLGIGGFMGFWLLFLDCTLQTFEGLHWDIYFFSHMMSPKLHLQENITWSLSNKKPNKSWVRTHRE